MVSPRLIAPATPLITSLLDHSAIVEALAELHSGRPAAIAGLTRPGKAAVAAALAHCG